MAIDHGNKKTTPDFKKLSIEVKLVAAANKG